MTLYLGENIISGSLNPTEPTRNLGQIIESILPLTDAGLHLLDGALIQGNGIYSDFVTKIGELSSLYPSVFVTEEAWQTSVNTYGVCGKFVYNANDNTVRLPKITGIIEGTTDLSALGDLVEAGLPIMTTGGAGSHSHSLGADVWRGADGNTQRVAWDGGDRRVGYATAWTSTVGDHTHSINTGVRSTNTVQPQTIKMFYYIVIATIAKTDIEVDIDEVTTDLNNKIDLDGTNATFPHIVEAYVNGTSGYNLYSNGYCEQWGRGALNEVSTVTITLLKPYINTNYAVSAVSITASTASDTEAGLQCTPISTTQITLTAHYINPNSQTACWQTCGYIR